MMTQRAPDMIQRKALRPTAATNRRATATLEHAQQARVTAIIPHRVNLTVTRPSFEDFLTRPFLASLAVDLREKQI